MKGVMVAFASEQRGVAYDALNTLGVVKHVGGWYAFDDVQHDNATRLTQLTQLTHGDDVYIVPTSNILMIRSQGERSE